MRRLLATTVLFAALLGTVALVAQTPTTSAETLRGKDESCWDPQPGKGKSTKMWCDPPYCGPCFEVACEPGICHFVCVPIPGCVPPAANTSGIDGDSGRIRSPRISAHRRS